MIIVVNENDRWFYPNERSIRDATTSVVLHVENMYVWDYNRIVSSASLTLIKRRKSSMKEKTFPRMNNRSFCVNVKQKVGKVRLVARFVEK